jgi:SAM-dependent methyltransferase
MLTLPTPMPMHAHNEPSPWLLRWAHLLPAGGQVLDLACGRGRHLRWLVDHGFVPTGVDRDADALQQTPAGVATVLADIEAGPWPLPGRLFDAVLVFNYLWRPLWPQILAAVAPGGVLVYETFAQGNQTVGKPARPDFLLQPGELLQRCASLRTVAYEDGFLEAPERFVQRIVAVREHPASVAPVAPAAPPRHRLQAAGG